MPNTEVKPSTPDVVGVAPVRYGSRLAHREFSSAGRASALQAEVSGSIPLTPIGPVV